MEIRYLLMDRDQAAIFRDETATRSFGLDPILVRGGEHEGKYVLPEKAVFDSNHADLRSTLRMLTPITLDTEVIFPRPPEEDEELVNE